MEVGTVGRSGMKTEISVRRLDVVAPAGKRRPYRLPVRRVLEACVVLAAGLAVAPSAHAAAGPTACWQARVARAAAWADGRVGEVSFALVGAGGSRYGHRASRTAPTASLLKALVLVAYLRQPAVAGRALRPQ